MSISISSSGAERRVGRPQREVAQNLASTILVAARELFLSKGFAATSVQDIAQRAGVTKRTLYVKVGDKEAIFGAVVGAMLQDWRSVAARADATDAQVGDALDRRFERLGRELLAVMLEPDMIRLHRVMLSEAYRFPSMVSLLATQIEQGPIPQLARMLMQARGGSGSPADADQVAARMFYDMIVAAPMRVALTGRAPSIDITHDEWVRQAVTLFLRGWQATSGVLA